MPPTLQRQHVCVTTAILHHLLEFWLWISCKLSLASLKFGLDCPRCPAWLIKEHAMNCWLRCKDYFTILPFPQLDSNFSQDVQGIAVSYWHVHTCVHDDRSHGACWKCEDREDASPENQAQLGQCSAMKSPESCSNFSRVFCMTLYDPCTALHASLAKNTREDIATFLDFIGEYSTYIGSTVM